MLICKYLFSICRINSFILRESLFKNVLASNSNATYCILLILNYIYYTISVLFVLLLTETQIHIWFYFNAFTRLNGLRGSGLC